MTQVANVTEYLFNHLTPRNSQNVLSNPVYDDSYNYHSHFTDGGADSEAAWVTVSKNPLRAAETTEVPCRTSVP